MCMGQNPGILVKLQIAGTCWHSWFFILPKKIMENRAGFDMF